jgi:manganese-dependent inorganic pyrophosphatase
MVDHNEKTQTISNIDELKVVTIIDHHKFAFTTTEPTEINVLPIASTCSVLYKMRIAAGFAISREEAMAMIM